MFLLLVVSMSIRCQGYTLLCCDMYHFYMPVCGSLRVLTMQCFVEYSFLYTQYMFYSVLCKGLLFKGKLKKKLSNERKRLQTNNLPYIIDMFTSMVYSECSFKAEGIINADILLMMHRLH